MNKFSALLLICTFVSLINAAVDSVSIPGQTVYKAQIPTDSSVSYWQAKWAAWIPPECKTIRAIILHQHGCSANAEENGLTTVYDEHWRSLAKKYDCALIGSSLRGKNGCGDWNNPALGTDKAFLSAINEFSKMSSHPELSIVPWVLWGHSGGGRWSKAMAIAYREKILALFLRSSAGSADAKDTLLKKIPVVINPGIREKGNLRYGHIWVSSVSMHESARETGAITTWAPDPKSAHDCRFSRLFAIPFLDECLAQRLPKTRGSAAMQPMDMKKAWVGNIMDWSIMPATEFKGDLQHATWLPSERVARIWQEYVTSAWVTDLTPPPEKPTALAATVVTGATVLLTWKATADPESGIKYFRFYRDGKRIDDNVWEIDAKGNPVVEFQRPSFHDALWEPPYKMQYFDRNLAAGKTYKYQISTVNFSDLESARSEEISATIPAVNNQVSAIVPAPRKIEKSIRKNN